MSKISLTNTINITLGGVPQGLSEFLVSNIGLFSNETASFADEYRIYISPDDVATDFGSSSLTYKMANAIFAQTPNLRTGRGSLYIATYIATNATSGDATTTDLTANIANFKVVSDGAIIITIDGVATTLRNLNFTGISTLDDIVTVLNNANPDCFIDVAGNTIKFTSKLFGTGSTIVLSADTVGTDLSGANYLNVAGITTTTGTDAVDQESLVDAVTRVNAKAYFGGVLDTCYRDNTSIETNATGMQGKDKIYFVETASLNNMDVLSANIKLAGNYKTKVMAYSMSVEGSKEAISAEASKALSFNFSGSSTALTMNLKELATILPDSNLTQTYFGKAKTTGTDIYANTGGLGVVYSNSNNGYIDDRVNELWLKKELEVAGFNFLKQTNTKIPQTEAGMTGLKNAYARICEQAVRNGIIGLGLVWNSATKFGDIEDFDRNITEKGYYIYSLPISQQSQADRDARIAPLVQIAIKFAGAIHFSDVIVTIER